MFCFLTDRRSESAQQARPSPDSVENLIVAERGEGEKAQDSDRAVT